MGHCCWSRSWRRHSERTKWTRLQKQYYQDRKAKREKEEETSCYAVQTPIYASYYITGVRAFRIIFPFFCVPKARDFICCDLCFAPHWRHMCLFHHTTMRAFQSCGQAAMKRQQNSKGLLAQWRNVAIIAVWSRSLEESGTAKVDFCFYFLLHFINWGHVRRLMHSFQTKWYQVKGPNLVYSYIIYLA